MTFGPAESPPPPKNKHRWTPIDNTGRAAWQAERGDHCPDCGITRSKGGWRDRMGDWHTGPIPRCGDPTWGRP